MKKIKTVHDLEFDKQNFNKGNEQGKALIKKSITEHGTGRSILVDKNAKIIAGNKTTENFKELGFEKVKIVKAMPDELVVVQRDDIDLDTPQGRAMALADNKTSEANLEWDFEMMQEELPTEMLEDWGVQQWEQPDEVDYSILDDDEGLDVDLSNMLDSVKKAIMIEFSLEDYPKAYELVKFWRERELYIGGFLIEKLKEERGKI